METKHGSDMGYRTHYVVNGGKARIILAALVTPFEVTDNQPMLDLLWRVRFRWKLWPRQVTGDTKYGTEENIVAIEDQHIHAYIPLPDNDHRTAFFSSDRFRYEAERDVYLCPAGKELHLDRPHSTERSLRYRARAKDCNHCPLKAECTTSKQGRTLCRSVYEDYLDRVRAYHTTQAYKKAYRKCSVWVEPLFAEGKDWHGMRRFRLRRLWRVNCEALMRAAGQNLKRLLKKRGWGRRPWPQGAAHAFLEPPSEEHMHLHAPSLAEKALACEEHRHVKDFLKLASPLEHVSPFHASSWIPLSLFFSPRCSQSLFVWPFLCLVWISPALFLHKAGPWRLEVTGLFSL